MKIEEGQKKQIIILCCLIILVLGLAVYRVVGTSTQDVAKISEKVQPKEEPAKNEEAPPAETQAVASTIIAPSEQSGKGRDPFAPQVVPSQKGSVVASNIRTTVPPLFGSGRPPIDAMPPLIINRPEQNHSASPSAPEENPTQELKLTGVIEGSINVAIIRGPENTRYIVREGQVIDGKYRIASISRAGVRIIFNNRTYVLRLGGNDATQNGARA